MGNRYEVPDASRHLAARMEQEKRERDAERDREQRLEESASSLLEKGYTLIPSRHLKDHELVVSIDVYEAYRKIVTRPPRCAWCCGSGFWPDVRAGACEHCGGTGSR